MVNVPRREALFSVQREFTFSEEDARIWSASVILLSAPATLGANGLQVLLSLNANVTQQMPI